MTAVESASPGDGDPVLGYNPWVPLAVVLAGTIMVALDTTIVNVALHQIGIDLNTGDANIEWVVTAYILAVCATQPATGWLTNRFGHKRLFLVSLGLFTGASALCGLSPNLGVLIVCRVVQGLGGGALVPVGMAFVLNTFPRHRHGRAISVYSMALMVAPGLGPTVGGYVVTSISWHWLFFVNVPIGIAVFILGRRLLPQIGVRLREPFDLGGLLLGSTGLTLFVLGISQGASWGWLQVSTAVCMLGGIAVFGVFVHHELRAEHPLLELRMFSERTFRIAMIGYVILVGTQLVRTVYIPLELQGLRGYTALKVGTLFIIPAVFTAAGIFVGGRLVDRIGPRRPVMIGASGVCLAMLFLSRQSLTTPVWAIITWLCLQSFGFGLTNAPTLVAGLSDMPKRLLAQASAVRSLMGQVAGALGIAVVGAVVLGATVDDPTPEQALHGYNMGFLACAVGTACAAALATRLPGRKPDTESPQEMALAAD